MKFYCKPTLTLFLLLYVAIQSAQAQDTLRITLQDAVRIALSDNPTIKVAGNPVKERSPPGSLCRSFPRSQFGGQLFTSHKKAVIRHDGRGD